MPRLEPSPQAREWGKRQASESPQWTDSKWNRIATIFEVVLIGDAQTDQDTDEHQDDQATDEHQDDQATDEAGRDAA